MLKDCIQLCIHCIHLMFNVVKPYACTLSWRSVALCKTACPRLLPPFHARSTFSSLHKTLFAIHRLVAARTKRNFALFTAVGTGCLKHLRLPPISPSPLKITPPQILS